MGIDIETKIERWRIKAELFLKKNTQCFIKTIDGSYHSVDILSVGEDTMLVYDFLKQQNFKIYWIDIILFEEFKLVREKEEEKDG